MVTDNQWMRIKLIDAELKKLLRESYEQDLKREKNEQANRKRVGVSSDVPSGS